MTAREEDCHLQQAAQSACKAAQGLLEGGASGRLAGGSLVGLLHDAPLRSLRRPSAPSPKEPSKQATTLEEPSCGRRCVLCCSGLGGRFLGLRTHREGVCLCELLGIQIIEPFRKRGASLLAGGLAMAAGGDGVYGVAVLGAGAEPPSTVRCSLLRLRRSP